MKLYFPLLLLCFIILLSSSLMDPAMAQAKSGDCCDNCSKTCEVQDRCIKYEECKCLSSGTCGNKQCPCYKDKKGYCSDECSTRCAEAGVQDRCIEYCGICSEECKCVPYGNYGNKHECLCNKNKKGYCSDKCSTRCAIEEVQDRCIKYCNKHECPCNKNKMD